MRHEKKIMQCTMPCQNMQLLTSHRADRARKRKLGERNCLIATNQVGLARSWRKRCGLLMMTRTKRR